MAGLLGLTFHQANFYNEEGEYVGKKRIKMSWWAIPKRTFKYGSGTYLYDPKATRSYITPFPWLFDYAESHYTVGNPQPFTLQTESPQSIIRAQDLNAIIESDALEKLNAVRKKGLSALLTPRNLIILAIGLFLFWYFSTGGSIGDLTSPPAQSQPQQASPQPQTGGASLTEGTPTGRVVPNEPT